MPTPAHLLWWLSHEYGQRLARASSYAALLEELLVERTDPARQTALVRALEEARQVLAALHDEFRGWRYAYFYDSPHSRRMVSRPVEIERAIAHFRAMRDRSLSDLAAMHACFSALPRPADAVTLVPNGDLWALFDAALLDLSDFDHDRAGIRSS